MVLVFVFCLSFTACEDKEKNISPSTATTTTITSSRISENITKKTTATKTVEKTTAEKTRIVCRYPASKNFSSVEEYKNEFMKYKSFNDIKESYGFADKYDKYARERTSLMLIDKYFLVMEYPDMPIEKISYDYAGSAVSFYYKKFRLSYETSREAIDYEKKRLPKSYDVLFVSNEGYNVYRTKRNSYFYGWYDEKNDGLFYIQFQSIKNEEDVKKVIDNITIEKINTI